MNARPRAPACSDAMRDLRVTETVDADVRSPAAFLADEEMLVTHDRRRLRLAIFTHDAYGLGHVRRCLRIAWALAERAPDSSILLVTGSSAVDVLGSLPPNADHVKIPTVVTSGTQGWRPPTLNVGLAEITFLRERVILETLRTFGPHVLLVDNFPLGSQRELLATVQELRRQSTGIVLGVRDVLDPPESVRRDWTRQGIYDVLERYYDRILVYGIPDVLDVADAYALPLAVAEKVRYCGYVTESAPAIRPEAEVRAELGIDGPFMLATVGGGGDGFPLLETFLEALPLLPQLPAVLVTGHLMAAADRVTLRTLASRRPAVVVIDQVRDLPSYLAAAEVVVAMGGYNTAAELLAVRAPAVIVPRTWKSGEHSERAKARADAEQLVRAQALARLGLVTLLEPGTLTVECLAAAVAEALARPRPALHPSVDLRGVDRVADEILALAYAREGVGGAWR